MILRDRLGGVVVWVRFAYQWLRGKFARLDLDLHYTAKLLRSVLSGYSGLVAKEWGLETEVDIAHTFTWRDANGYDPKYYSCLEFRNGRHLPVPLVIGGVSGLPIQDTAIRILKKLGCFRRAESDIERLWGGEAMEENRSVDYTGNVDTSATERLTEAYRRFRDEVFAMQSENAPAWVIEHGLLAVKLVAQQIALLYHDAPGDVRLAARFNPRHLVEMQDMIADWYEDEDETW